jgi:hypothetical protein
MMEAASTSDTPVNFYQNTWRNNPEEVTLIFVRNWNVTQQSDCFGVKVEAI